MRGLTRTGWVAGVAALSLALAACGGDDDDEAAETGAPEATEAAGDGVPTGSITINGTDPQNPFIPSDTGEVGGGWPIDNMFTRLVGFDPESAEPYNAMAESFETEDNQTWTITIKDGWTFHDGTPVTAQSFVGAWNDAAYGPNARYNSYFFPIIQGFDEVQGEDANGDEVITEDEAPVKEMSGLKVIDDVTFEVTLNEPFSIFPMVVGYAAFSPLPESFFEDPDAFGEAPIGNGPYKFVSYSLQEEIVLEAFEDYQGEDKPTVKDVTFVMYKDTEAAYADLLANNLDILDDIPTSAIAGETFKSDLGDRQVVQAQGGIQNVTFPLFVEEYNNVDLRKAISMAVDRQAIVDVIYEGSRVAADSFVPSTIAGYVEGACGENCEFNPEMAKELLDKAGGFEGTMTLSYNADGDHKAWTEAVCNSINSVLGIECVATPVVDFATFRTQIGAREIEGMTRSGWVMDYPHMENFLAPLYKTGSSSNDGDYSSEEFDNLIDEANKAPSIEEATELYQQAEQVVAQDMPVMPLNFYATIAGWSENIATVQFNADGSVALETLELAE